MVVGPFANIFNYLESLGFLDIILPFAIIFAILWATLNRIGLFEDKKIKLVIALAISIIAIYPHATGTFQEYDIVNFILTTFPQVGLILISLVLLMIVMGILGGRTGYKSRVMGIAGIIGVIFLLVILWRAIFPYQSPLWLGFLDDPNTQALLVIILVFALIVWFVTKPDKGEDDEDGKGWGDSLDSFLHGFYRGKKKTGQPPAQPPA